MAANSRLPTYEEVQREKTLHGEGGPGTEGGMMPPMMPLLLTMEAIDVDHELDSENTNGLLGTDFMFVTAFFGSYFFLLLFVFYYVFVLIDNLVVFQLRFCLIGSDFYY